MHFSGVNWIGNIPDDWCVKRVKDCFFLSKTKAKEDKPIVLSLARDSVRIRDISNNEGQLAESYFDYNPVKIGDLLLNPMDLYSGANCNVSQVEGVISPAYSNLRAKIDLNPKFFDYFFKTQYWTMAMFAHGKGVSFDNRWTLNNETLFSYRIPWVDKTHQDRIVEYLNRKINEIDTLIDNENEQLQKLSYLRIALISDTIKNGFDNCAKKETGMQFLRQVPENYSIFKFGKVCSVLTDYVASGSFADIKNNVKYLDEPNYAMLVRTTDLSGSSRSDKKVFISKESYDFLNNSNLFGGEIILPNIGASCGDVYIVPKLYEKMSLAPNSIMFKTNFNDKFYFYYFSSSFGRDSLLDLCASTAQQKFNKTELRAMKVVCPPIEVQNKIVDFLDEKCATIDNLILIKNKKIDSLNEYKKSLIFECVTGKKELLCQK